MSIDGSVKEFILSLIIKSNPCLVNPLIEGEFCFRELERRELYIDIYGLDKECNVPVLIESQLGVSDPRHYRKVKQIIDSIEEGIVIWIAKRFVDQYVDEIYHYLNFEIAKPINFYAVTFNEDYLVQIEKLNQMTQFEAWHYISEGLIELPVLSLYESIKIIPMGFIGEGLEEEDADLVSVKGKNNYLQQKLRERIPFLFNLHRSKKMNTKYFVIGGGMADIEFVVSVEDGRNRSFIRLRTTNHRHRDLLEEVKEMINESNFLSGMDFVFEKDSITHFIDSPIGVKPRVKEMATAFEKMVYSIVPIIDKKRYEETL